MLVIMGINAINREAGRPTKNVRACGGVGAWQPPDIHLGNLEGGPRTPRTFVSLIVFGPWALDRF